MRRKVLVPLLVTVELGDEVKVFAADDDRSVHLCRDDGACQDTASNGDHSNERTFLVQCQQLPNLLLSRRDMPYQCMCPSSHSLVFGNRDQLP